MHDCSAREHALPAAFSLQQQTRLLMLRQVFLSFRQTQSNMHIQLFCYLLSLTTIIIKASHVVINFHGLYVSYIFPKKKRLYICHKKALSMVIFIGTIPKVVPMKTIERYRNESEKLDMSQHFFCTCFTCFIAKTIFACFYSRS